MKSEENRTNALPLTDTESASAADESASATEEKASATEEKVSATEEKASATEEKVSATEEKASVTEEKAKKPRRKKEEKPPMNESAGEADTDTAARSEGEPATESATEELEDGASKDGHKVEDEAEAEAELEAPAPTDGVEPVADEAATEPIEDESEPENKSDAEDGAEGASAEDVESAPVLVDVELTEAIEDESPSATEVEPEPVTEGADEEDEGKTRAVKDGAYEPSTPKREKKPRESGARRVDGLFDFIELFVFTLAVVLIVTAFFVRHSVVDGDSMLGTLHDGENLLISDFMYTPERGDIVVVEDHSTILKKPIIKRIIAVGGDTVRITRHAVIVNGEPLTEEYVFTDDAGYVYDIYPSEALLTNDTLFVKAGEYYEFVVPDGELFVMGDHRNKSTDSRDIGTVDEDAVLGRVILRFYPFDKFGKVE